MSRQNKAKRINDLKKQITIARKAGQKQSRTKKLTSINKGLCKIVKVNNKLVRMSVSLINQKLKHSEE